VINVLVLGETGVGKSTWINAFLLTTPSTTPCERPCRLRGPNMPCPFYFLTRNETRGVREAGRSKSAFIEVGKSEDENPR